MALIQTSLLNATSVGPGSILSFDVPKTQFSMQVLFAGTGNNSGFLASTTVVLEYSLDGVTFFSAGKAGQAGLDGNANFLLGALAVFYPGLPDMFVSIPNSHSGSSISIAAPYVRANVLAYNGGTTGITAIIAAA